MWGVSLIIFNQGVLNSASQFSSQTGLVEYSRNTYQAANVGGLETQARNRSWRAAYTVFMSNSCGLLSGSANSSDSARALARYCRGASSGTNETTSYRSSPFGPLNFRIGISCTNILSDLNAVSSWDNVGSVAGQIESSLESNKCASDQGREAVRVIVEGRIYTPFTLSKNEQTDRGNSRLSADPNQIRRQSSAAASYLIRPVPEP